MIDANKQLEATVQWIKEYFAETGGETAVIGISGGKDSTVCAALLARALGPKNVIGVLMPNGEQSDIEDAHRVVNALGIGSMTVNIKDIYNSFIKILEDTRFMITSISRNNLGPRIRMAMLYCISASLPHGRVCNTSNCSECLMGWSTKWGDICGDFSLINHLFVSDVIKLGLAMPEIPKDLIIKPPADGLTGKTDEENWGVSYEDVENYGLGNYDLLTEEVKNKIDKRTKSNAHKYLFTLPSPPGIYEEDGNTIWLI